MLSANGRNYDIQITLYTSTPSAAVGGKYDKRSAVQLLSNMVSELEIHESLLKPYFDGHFTYRDRTTSSDIAELVNSPFIYANVTFAMVDGREQKGRPENDSYNPDETFSETVVVDSIVSSACEGSPEKLFTFHFSSADALRFGATLEPYSTFGRKDGMEDLDKVLRAVFSGAGLGEKLELKDGVPTLRIPFLTSENATLSTSLDYIYRRAFDCNILDDNSKNAYFKIVYDHVARKYKAWRLDDVGGNPEDDVPRANPSNAEYIKFRRFVDCDMSEGMNSPVFETGGRNVAVPMYSGNAFDLMKALADKRYYGYDYVANDFKGNERKVVAMYKNNLHDHWQPDKYFLKTTLLPKSLLDKSLRFDNAFSRFRENGSVYDVYNELVFGSAYLHVQSDGVIGRKAGDAVYVNFLNSHNGPYERLCGDYFITDIRNRFMLHDPENRGLTSFRSIMECVSPYMMTPSNARDAQIYP